MTIPAYHKLSTFLGHIRLFARKESESYHLFIIDGPNAIKISALLVNSGTPLTLRFIASAHYLTRLDETDASLKQRMVGWQVSTLFKGAWRYLCACKNAPHKIPPVSELRALTSRECIESHIKSNLRQIKSVVVFNERNPFPAYAVASAKKHAIATACIQHGAIVENYFPVYVDAYFTWSDYYSRLLERRVPGLKTSCIGRLGYQIPSPPPRSEKTSSLLIVLQPADVSIAGDALLSHFQQVLEVCYRFFDTVTLRPHPSDNIMPDIAAFIGNRFFSVDSGSLDDALSAHAITISLYSTVLFEAPLFDSVPVQYLATHLSGELMERSELRAESPEDLHAIIKSLQDKTYFDACLDNAKKYAEQRMTSGNSAALFSVLEHTRTHE